jgi:hypothetical protein
MWLNTSPIRLFPCKGAIVTESLGISAGPRYEERIFSCVCCKYRAPDSLWRPPLFLAANAAIQFTYSSVPVMKSVRSPSWTRSTHVNDREARGTRTRLSHAHPHRLERESFPRNFPPPLPYFLCKNKKYSVAWVCERTIPTERPSTFEDRGVSRSQRQGSSPAVISIFYTTLKTYDLNHAVPLVPDFPPHRTGSIAVNVGSLVDKATVGLFLLHRLLHTHYLPSEAATISKILAEVPNGPILNIGWSTKWANSQYWLKYQVSRQSAHRWR